MTETYKIQRICSSCGNKESISVSKREAAFELVDINKVLGQECQNCHGREFSAAYEAPELDYELLLEWATNQDLYLMPQDEELILADEKYLDNILKILDSAEIHDHKRDLLFDALCIIVYDNSVDGNSKKNEQLKRRVINELNLRIDKLKLADSWIMDYIKEVVFPQLKLNEK